MDEQQIVDQTEAIEKEISTLLNAHAELNKLWWLKQAQWWFRQVQWDLDHLNALDALQDLIRGLRNMAWGLGSKEALEIIE